MKLYISNSTPFIISSEDKKSIVEDLKFFDGNSQFYESSLLRWEVGYLILSFKKLNKEKFNQLYSIFSDSKLRKEMLYAKFGIPLVDSLSKKFEEFHIVVFTEELDNLCKCKKSQLILDLIRDNSLSCEVNPLGRENAKLKKFYPIYLREETNLRLIGYACKISTSTSTSKYIYVISIKKLPEELKTNYKFLKSLILNLRELWIGRIYSSKEVIPKSDVETILCGNKIKFSVEVGCEIYDEDGKLVPPYSVLLSKFYSNEENVDLREKEIGVDEYCHICRVKTKLENIDDSSKVLENLESLTKKLIEELKDKYKVDFIGKKYPLSFSLIFDFGEKFKTIHPLVKLYIKNSIEFLIQTLLYRYLCVLNSPVRRYYFVETVKVFESGIKCNILPSAVMNEELYKEVIVIVADAVKRFFSGEVIEIELNEQFDIDKSFYSTKFFERIRKIKEVLEKETNEFYELVSLSLTDRNKLSETNFDKVKEFGNLIKELNDKYLEDSYITFYSVGMFEEKVKLVREFFYDVLNEKEVKVYQLQPSVYLLIFASSGSKIAWEKIVDSTIVALRLVNFEDKLKESFENIEKKLSDFLHS